MKRFVLWIFICGFLMGCGNAADFKVRERLESFGQKVTYDNRVDILWVVDSSSSMGRYQSQIADKFGSFVDVLQQKNMSFRMAVTTMDMGNGGQDGAFVGSPSVIIPSTPNLKNEFIENVLVGESGSAIERGIDAVYEALSLNKLQNENQGFLRDGALLSVIFVSNEDDRSSYSVNDLKDYLTQLKPNNEYDEPMWVANYIGISEPDGYCKTTDTYSDPGDKFIELAEHNDGVVTDICQDDLSGALGSLRQRIIERLSEFFLKRPAVYETINVFVNNIPIQESDINGWKYNAQKQSIKFYGDSVPGADSNIQIYYEPDLNFED